MRKGCCKIKQLCLLKSVRFEPNVSKVRPNTYYVRSNTMYPHLLYISTSIWVLRMPNAGRNRHFSFFAVFFELFSAFQLQINSK